MDWIIYIFLGLVQGITEWLPISSSGHLVIFEEIFNVKPPGMSFEVLLNFATFIALVIVFRKELIDLIIGFFRFLFKRSEKDKTNFYFGLYIIIGVIPVAILGLKFQNYIGEHLKSLTTVAISLIITGLGLYYVSKIRGSRKELKFKDAIWVGLFQAVSLIPGISRSGATIFASLFRKLDKELAIKYSFFLAIPVSLGTMLLKVDDLITQTSTSDLLNYAIAFVVALVSAIFAIKWFVGIIQRGKLIYFTYYCVAIGTLILLFQIFN